MRRGNVAAVEPLKEVSDDAAIRQAATMFLAHMGKFEGYEIWDQNRVVFRFPYHPPFSPAA
jgi:hypothetical protein